MLSAAQQLSRALVDSQPNAERLVLGTVPCAAWRRAALAGVAWGVCVWNGRCVQHANGRCTARTAAAWPRRLARFDGRTVSPRHGALEHVHGEMRRPMVARSRLSIAGRRHPQPPHRPGASGPLGRSSECGRVQQLVGGHRGDSHRRVRSE